MKGFEYLIQPYDLQSFMDNFLNKKALHIHGESDKFYGLTDWKEINHFLNYGELEYPRVRLALDKEVLPAENLKRLHYWLKQGSTLIIDRFDKKNEKIALFTAGIRESLVDRIQVNCYVSWTGKQGFDCHYDTHDVFILQIEGKKHWKVFEATTQNPLKKLKHFDFVPPEEPYLELTLSKGDVLYIPKGHWHYAISETSSVHLTLGILNRTGIDFLKWFADELRENVVFRKNLPLFIRDQSSAIEQPNFSECIKKLQILASEYMQDKSLAEKFLDFCVASDMERNYFQLPTQVILEEAINIQTQLKKVSGKKFLIKYQASQKITTVIFSGNKLKIQNVLEGVIEYILFSDTTSGQEVLSQFPDMSWNDLRDILQMLVEYNFLIFA